tara:strand:+ start:325 stop:765 length:441 start_codon:yes stop_codon:yes gene_type:complete
MRKLIGSFGVDSGQVLIGDPCYLDKFINDDSKLTRRYQHTTTNKILTQPTDFFNYEEYKEDGLSMNEMIHNGIYKKLPPEVNPTYSYSGACSVTCNSKESAGELANGLAVVSSTGYGDGCYPVYATENEDGYIVKIEILFDEEDED